MCRTVDDALRFMLETTERADLFEWTSLAMSLMTPWKGSGPLRAIVRWHYDSTPALTAAWTGG